ncbi:MAG: DegV family EDD domain-containing protein [Lachnospiraceae bacterium]|nr:DegV family EDD domain-containing protein [Lachnospiraceae bacterium]
MLRKWIGAINDDNRNIRERILVLMASIAMVTMLVVLLLGYIIGENAADIITIAATLVIFLLIAYFSIKYDRLDIGGKIAGCLIVFVVLPVTFITGGGLYGGAPLWVLFCTVFIALVITGRFAAFLLISDAVIMAAAYAYTYTHPELVEERSKTTIYADSLVSLIIACGLVILMIRYQMRIYDSEAEKSKKRQDEIKALNDSQNRFFSGMSHEIRTPINTIIGLNEMILREEISPEVAMDAQNIQAASKMLLHTINDILDMSKIESGQMRLAPVTYKTGDMLSDIVNMIWKSSQDKGLIFTVNVTPDLPSELRGDDMRIKQILINVLNNAVKYTKEGSVSLSIDCEKKSNNEVKVIYSISDTGMGIKKENIPYLFTAFKRVDEDKNRFIEGTGLGLSIVKQLVDIMNGRITVNSVYTKGSTFIIEIPQQIVSDGVIGQYDIGMSQSTGKYKDKYAVSFVAPEASVLVVDDNSSNRIVISKLLRDTRIQVDVAESGAKALAKTLEKKYDIILMDHMMPEMDGIECMHKIRTQAGGYNKESIIVALTANVGTDLKQMYEREGFDGYLIKPISGKELEAAVSGMLPKELVTRMDNDSDVVDSSMEWLVYREKKRPVAITTESVADLPKSLVEKYNIAILPHKVRTGDGIFMDGEEIETRGLLAYMANLENRAETSAPSVEEHEEFFARQLETASNIIHISISGEVRNSGYHAALEAAKAFDNVSVVDTGHLSSGQGIMTLEACRMAADGYDVSEIIERMEEIRGKVRTSFVLDNLDYMARAGQLSSAAARFIRAFMIHPVVALIKGEMKVRNIYMGTRKQTWKKYIESVLNGLALIDKEMVFVTYVGLTGKDLEYIGQILKENAEFENVYFVKASPAIAVNCGPGTFGILYRLKD